MKPQKQMHYMHAELGICLQERYYTKGTGKKLLQAKKYRMITFF
jgi:hypothetical protein